MVPKDMPELRTIYYQRLLKAQCSIDPFFVFQHEVGCQHPNILVCYNLGITQKVYELIDF